MKKIAFIMLVLLTILLILLSQNIISSKNLVVQLEKVNLKSTINTETWDKNKVSVHYDADSKTNVPIPIGYVVSGVTGENKVNTGLVIYEGTASVTSAPTSGSSVLSSAQATRNQWVWVPVPDVSRIYEETNGIKKSKLWTFSNNTRTAYTNNNLEPAIIPGSDNEKWFSQNSLQGLTRSGFYQKMQLDFDETIESIKKYGGFYIGRYETGNVSKNTPVVQKMNTDTTGQYWYLTWDRIKYLAQNKNVKTGIIWGCLWDETIQWLIDSGGKNISDVVDSKTFGNYVNSTFTYVNTSGSSVKKSTSSQLIIPTGSTEYTKANNIYDMAGNIYDWTMETEGSAIRRLRGGCYGFNGGEFPIYNRYGDSPQSKYSSYGVRAYMYIR